MRIIVEPLCERVQLNEAIRRTDVSNKFRKDPVKQREAGHPFGHPAS